jgi:undecaprenyl pyrophosphate phosphatase UppP
MQCPYCRNEILGGATVCGHCGAYEQNTVGPMGCLGVVIGAIAGFFVAFIALAVLFRLNHPDLSVFGFVLFPLFGIVLGLILVPKRKVWIHKR